MLRKPSPAPAYALAVVLAVSLAIPAGATLITVDDPDDVATAGQCSLREAIDAANTNAAVDTCPAGGATDTIEFSDAFACPTTITLTALLPALTAAGTTIDGYSHSGSAVNTAAVGTNATLCIVLNAGGFAQGLTFSASTSRVRGLNLQNYSTDGVLINVGTGSTVDGNFIGTNVAGTAASGFVQGFGVQVQTDGNTVGGTTADARNLLSGGGGYQVLFFGADNGFIQGNLIGTNAAGTAAIAGAAPGTSGINVGGSGNLVGGAAAGARNVVSGGNFDGIQILGPGAVDNTVQGNYIGVDAAGTAALGNARHGVVLFHDVAGAASSGNTVDGNVIAGNPRKAIAVDGPPFTGTVVTGNLIGTLADGLTPAPNGFGAEPGIALLPDPAIDILHAATATVADNHILYQNGGAGLLIRNVEFNTGDPDLGPGALLATSSNNCVVFNAEGAVNTTGVLNVFENNWWGSPSGPSGVAPGTGDSVSADIDYEPFLVVAPLGCPSYPTLAEIPTLHGAGAGLLALLLAAAALTLVWRRHHRIH